MGIENCTDATLLCIDESKVIEGPDGRPLIPMPNRLVNVCLSNEFLHGAIQTQRYCERNDEPFVIRLLPDEADPLAAPIFAVAILTPRATFIDFPTTGGKN